MKKYELFVNVTDDGNTRYIVENSSDVVKMMRESLHIDKLIEEYLYIVGLNTIGEVIGVSEVSHGTLDQSLVHPRSIFTRAILMSCAGFVLVHNHPSGRFTPSGCDRDVTEKIKEAGHLLGITLADHIIISNEGYYSFRDENEL